MVILAFVIPWRYFAFALLSWLRESFWGGGEDGFWGLYLILPTKTAFTSQIRTLVDRFCYFLCVPISTVVRDIATKWVFRSTDPTVG